jgi:hypothetical protein
VSRVTAYCAGRFSFVSGFYSPDYRQQYEVTRDTAGQGLGRSRASTSAGGRVR